MLEIPESAVIAQQISETLCGKIIDSVQANASPHRFAFYFGDPLGYGALLAGKTVGAARAISGMIEIEAEDSRIVFGDGAAVRYFEAGAPVPAKHQLHLTFRDGSSIVCTVQMYGGLWAFREGTFDSPYYAAAREKPPPLSEQFDRAYFQRLLRETKDTLSLKAFLATEQRIPGLGNGVLQDILFQAGLNPKRKLSSLTDEEKDKLFAGIKRTLDEMTKNGGRDTEKDLFGNAGGYRTILSAKTCRNPCPVCGGSITKQAYLGGSVYFCETCQPF